MTLPDERYRAVIQAATFMRELAYDRKVYPRLPKEVRQRAQAMLRHYPDAWEMQYAATKVPDIFCETMEPVSRLIAQYEESKKNA